MRLSSRPRGYSANHVRRKYGLVRMDLGGSLGISCLVASGEKTVLSRTTIVPILSPGKCKSSEDGFRTGRAKGLR